MAETPPERFLAFLPSLFEQGRPLEILEVGGGSVSHVAVPGARYTVLDADAASVSRNAYADQVLIGDIQACDLPAHRFDAIVFWNVLEHVGEPERAVASAVRALKPHGVLIVRGPMIRSLKALVTLDPLDRSITRQIQWPISTSLAKSTPNSKPISL
ncbi:MAG: methyltransferase domain-containing protein, partial [Pseudomonadota bacterium]